jgi:hypothetical protein
MNMHHARWGCCIFILLVCGISGGAAETRQLSASDTQPPTVRAVRLEPDESIAMDGRLDEAAWGRADPATDFRQSDPQNGDPATERTEVRILFSRDSLYIGAEFFDSDPDGVLGNQMTRDGPLEGDDRFMWTLDPFLDQRSGYFFEINPSGAMGDAQLLPGSGGNFGTTQNRAWDGIWLARVTRHDEGWTAEIEIPFRTLNFDPNAAAWGANFQRTVRRKNEEGLWAGWRRNQGILNLTASGRIEGIADVSQGRGVDIQPWVIGRYSAESLGGTSASYTGDAGLDLFYNLTPGLRANVTSNTDFAQIEVDDRQVNLTQFALFFPEKRDFFLEGASNFDFARESNRDLTAFHSRRIGLGEDGRPQKIDYGVKLGGQANAFDVGLLHVRTAADLGVLGEDFTVFRPKRRWGSQSYAGLIYTRRATRDSAIPDRHTIGFDVQLATPRFRGNQNLRFSAFVMKTPNSARQGDNLAFGARVDYPNDRWSLRTSYKEYQKNFDPTLGFVGNRDYRKLAPTAIFSPRPRNSRWIRRFTFQAAGQFWVDSQNKWFERSYRLTLLGVDFQSGDRLSIQALPRYDRLRRDFRITRGITLPEGNDYQYTRYSFGFNTADRRTVSGNANVTVGTFFSGHRRDLSAGLNLRPFSGVLATLDASFSRVELAEGNFSTRILRAVINTQFSPFISVSNNIQYDSVSRILGWQSRFRWTLRPGNDLYVVWLDRSLDSDDQWMTLDRSLATKLLYTHRF